MIDRSLAGLLQDSRLWFPGLAEILADTARYGVEPSEADMARPATPATVRQIQIGRHRAAIAPPSATVAAEFDDIDFADPTDTHIQARLQAAADLLDRVDTLSDAVGTVVDTIYPLRAPSGHDISYSTPEMPYTIFVSIPGTDERDAPLRVAEAVLHEAMHLQLTLLDLALPLTHGGDARGYSPWKQEDRPLLGLLHGLYVFAVICQVMNAGSTPVNDKEGRLYRAKRIAEIQDEVTTLPPRSSELSLLGSDLWDRCLRAIASMGQLRPPLTPGIQPVLRQRP